MMTPEMQSKLKRSVTLHESCNNFPYIDTRGNITIGIGYNLSVRGLDDSWINHQYDADVGYFYTQLDKNFKWFMGLDENRKVALVDMCFMGFKKFCGFTKMIDALAKKDYETASKEMLDSQWATEVKGRATTLSQVILTGVYDI
jgi:lysozyme